MFFWFILILGWSLIGWRHALIWVAVWLAVVFGPFAYFLFSPDMPDVLSILFMVGIEALDVVFYLAVFKRDSRIW